MYLLLLMLSVLPVAAHATDYDNDLLRQQYKIEDLERSNKKLQKTLSEQQSQIDGYADQQQPDELTRQRALVRSDLANSNKPDAKHDAQQFQEDQSIELETRLQRIENQKSAANSQVVLNKIYFAKMAQTLRLKGFNTQQIESIQEAAKASIYREERDAINGDAQAQASIGEAYLDDELLKQNYGKALDWLIKAANQNNGDAQYNLFKIYEGGLGVRQDNDQAAFWIKKARCNQNPKALAFYKPLITQGLKLGSCE